MYGLFMRSVAKSSKKQFMAIKVLKGMFNKGGFTSDRFDELIRESLIDKNSGADHSQLYVDLKRKTLDLRKREILQSPYSMQQSYKLAKRIKNRVFANNFENFLYEQNIHSSRSDILEMFPMINFYTVGDTIETESELLYTLQCMMFLYGVELSIARRLVRLVDIVERGTGGFMGDVYFANAKEKGFVPSARETMRVLKRHLGNGVDYRISPRKPTTVVIFPKMVHGKLKINKSGFNKFDLHMKMLMKDS